MAMRSILILGANSGMARALAHEIARADTQLILAGRQVADLEATAADLAIRTNTPKPLVMAFDATATETHADFLAALQKQVSGLDEVYLFFGVMHDQQQAQTNLKLALEMLWVNYLGAVSILELIARQMEGQHRGVITVVSSVAGDRGRQSNYFYGSAKAGLSAYLQGLRNRLAPQGVHVLTIKPGFVDTAMTSRMKKGLLFTSPTVIAKGIVRAVRRRRDIVYLPGYWRGIMLIIRMIPESMFKKMKL